jgi:hypothetical protein
MPRGIYERKPRAKQQKPTLWCRVDGCERQANRRGARLCEMHYGRQRAHGAFELPARDRPEFYVDRAGYHRVSAPGHPLACRGGTAMRHRVVYYDANGAGPFPCHWCGKVVAWAELHIDHLNDTPSDNRLENLAASCPPCNMNRGRHKTTRTLRSGTPPSTPWTA